MDQVNFTDEEYVPDFMQLVTQAASQDPEVQCQAVASVRKLISFDVNSFAKFASQLINCGILPVLVNCLRTTSNPSLQVEAAWALTNIAFGSSSQTLAVVEAGAVPLFVELLSSPHQNVCEQAVWALGNISGDGPQLRDCVISTGAVAPLLKLTGPNVQLTLLRNVTWVLCNLCQGRDPPPPIQTLMDILPTLNGLAYHTDTKVLVNSVMAISHVADAGNQIIQMIADSVVLFKLVSLLSHQNDEVQNAALRAVGNIVSGTDEQTQAVLNFDALRHFPALLAHPSPLNCKEALWFLSNVTGGNDAQIQAVIDANLIPLILQHLDKGELQIQKQAAWVVCNTIAGGNKAQVAHLINVGVIPPFCNLLNCGDIEITQKVLVGICNMLKMSSGGAEREWMCSSIKECGGLDKIEKLQYHQNLDIFSISNEIIDSNFMSQELMMQM